ncbi:MAG: Rpp14/Pop5 family protein [Patescibacteria group bacterium]|nr:Rpp14/Pop5 family protein [Patescibacteria group bacterium]
MLKLKALKPALREKKRYIVYQLESADNKTLKMFNYQQELVKKLQELLGVFNAAQAGILPLKIDNEKQRGIIRVNHTAVDQIRSCFVLIDELNKTPLRVSTRGVSGIMKKAKEKYLCS